MKTFEERWTRWMDGKMSVGELEEFSAELSKYPRAEAERVAVEKIGQLLRGQVVPPMRNEDFFNEQLAQRMRVEGGESEGREGGFLGVDWGARWRWLIWGGVVGAVVVGGLIWWAGGEKGNGVEVVGLWPGDPSISASTIYDRQEKITIVWLEGLDYIPPTYALK